MPLDFLWKSEDISLRKSFEDLNLNPGDDLLLDCFDSQSPRKRSTYRLRLQNKEVELSCPSDQSPDTTRYNFYICGIFAERSLNISGILMPEKSLPQEAYENILSNIKEFLSDRELCS